MRVLYHESLDAGSRVVRIQLAEKRLEAELRPEDTRARREAFLRLNPACEVPVLVEAEGQVVAGARVIAEYLEEVHPEPGLLGRGPAERAEVRRLVDWFLGKFQREVTDKLIAEKVTKRLVTGGTPEARALRAGLHNLHTHLAYVGWLAERRRWLAGDALSLADIAAAAQLSTVDYLGDVPWEDHGEAKTWYARLKSRPSLRPLLADHVAGVAPPKHYADLDF